MKDSGNDILVSEKNNKNYYFSFSYNLIYCPEVKSHIYNIEIWEKGKEAEKKFTSLLRVMENQKDLKVIDLFPPDYYRGKGISIAMILKARELFKKRIISSSNTYKSHRGEMRWKDATEKVWDKLVILGLARYDQTFDYYYTI